MIRLTTPGLRFRVTFMLALLPVLVAGGLGFVLIERQHVQVERALAARFSTAGDHLAMCVTDHESSSPHLVDQMFERLAEEEELVLIEVFESTGAVRRKVEGPSIGEIEAATLPPPDTARRILEIGPEPGEFLHGSGHVLAVTAPVQGGGAVRVVYSTREANREVTLQAWRGLALASAGLLLGLTMAWRFDRRVRRIVEDLSAAGRKIAGGDLGERLAAPDDDELEDLVGSFNRLAVDLARTQGEMERLLLGRTQALAVAEELAAHHEQMAAAGLLAAGLAHEVGNPLASISGVVQRLLAEELEPGLRGRLERILDLVDRIDGIIRGLQQFSSGDRPATEPVDAWRLAREAVELAADRTEAAGIEVRYEEPVGPCRVLAAADQLRQVLVNLAVNAVRAMEGGGTLSIGARSTRGEIWIDMSDTGCGMAPEVARQVFNPFYSGRSPSGRPAGVGLGLAISYAIVRRLGGRIEVESAPGVGSTFSVVLPTLGEPTP